MKHEHETESSLVSKGPCEDCGSSDACALYDDNHTFCFSCGVHHQGDGEQHTPSDPEPLRRDLIRGELEPLRKRKLDLKTVEKFGYRVGTHHGHPVQIAPYHDAAGRVVAQKVRDAEKNMEWVGSPKQALPLFGQHLWRDGGKMVVVTEGEIDAMSVAQAQGLKWPVVSIQNGAPNAAKSIAAAADWLEGFDKVVLMFDMDDAGRQAAVDAARVLTPGKVFIAKLPLKDANEMVVAGRSAELVNIPWDAAPYRPDGIIRVSDAIDDALSPPQWGIAWPWRGLTEATYGIRRSELYGWGAGVGAGKTTAFKQLIAATVAPALIADHGDLPVAGIGKPRKAGTLLLEENAKRKTLKAITSMILGRRLHVPGVDYDPEEARATMESLQDWLFMYDHFGAKDWDGIKDILRHMILGEGIEDLFLDNLTALLAFADDDRKALDGIMADMASLVERHNVTLHFVSHLTTPDGKAHEEGGRVLAKQFTGGRAIARWSHNMLAIERDQQDPDAPTILRVLKDRETGDGTGALIGLEYARDTGRYVEIDLPDTGSGFKDETRNDDF